MKNKYRLIPYVFIFLAGYCSNFLFPIDLFSARSSSLDESSNVQNAQNNNTETDKNNSLNNINANKKPIEVGTQKSDPKHLASVSKNENQSANKSESLAAINSELAMLRDYRMQAEIDKHNEYLQAHGGSSVGALNDNFTRESVDSVWAKEKENLINNLVDRNEHLSQLPRMTSECRSKQCKLSLLSDDKFYLDKLYSSLDKIITDHETSFSSYTTVIDEQSHTTSIYFSRN